MNLVSSSMFVSRRRNVPADPFEQLRRKKSLAEAINVAREKNLSEPHLNRPVDPSRDLEHASDPEKENIHVVDSTDILSKSNSDQPCNQPQGKSPQNRMESRNTNCRVDGNNNRFWGELQNEPSEDQNYPIQETEQDIVIIQLEDALLVQKQRFLSNQTSKDRIGPSSYDYTSSIVIRLLHALALEYKHRKMYEKAVSHLKEALGILNDILNTWPFVATVPDQRDSSMNTCFTPQVVATAHDSVDNSNIHLVVTDDRSKQTKHAASQSQQPHSDLLAEKSTILSSLGNIHRLQDRKNDALGCYRESMKALSDAGWPNESPRVTMLVRIMNRMEGTNLTVDQDCKNIQ